MTPRAPHNSGPVPEKTIGWLWGFLCGAVATGAIAAIAIARILNLL